MLRPIQHRSEKAQADLMVIRVRAALVEARTGLGEHGTRTGWIATDGPRQYWESLTPAQRVERGIPASLLTTNQIADAVVRLATDESLAGRVVLWWSDDQPKLVEWGDPGYRESSSFTLA